MCEVVNNHCFHQNNTRYSSQISLDRTDLSYCGDMVGAIQVSGNVTLAPFALGNCHGRVLVITHVNFTVVKVNYHQRRR